METKCEAKNTKAQFFVSYVKFCDGGVTYSSDIVKIDLDSIPNTGVELCQMLRAYVRTAAITNGDANVNTALIAFQRLEDVSC